jgi:sec-independent protein translocase protein TatB
MFDVGFSELLVIGLVALIVIGPERLPKVARTAGQWLGRLNRYVSQVKQDIDRDIKLEELRKMQQEMKETAQKYEILAGNVAREAETVVEQETTQISRVMQAMSTTDGGLAQQEYDRIKAEGAAQAAAALPPAVLAETPPVPADPAPAEAGATDGKANVDDKVRATGTPATKDERPVPPKPVVASAADDYPDGPVG